MPLTGKQRQFLRALAHHRKASVQVGTGGVTEALTTKVHNELVIHELIKVKVGKEATISVTEAGDAIVAATGAEVAQIIGRTIVLFRGRKKKPGIKLPPSNAPEDPPGAEPTVDAGIDEDEE
jgi:RNA-binding protein